MAANTQYLAQDGERWDTIAHKAYGRASLMKPIIEANPTVPVTPRLEAGTVLIIPVIDEIEVKTDKELLPPWKQ